MRVPSYSPEAVAKYAMALLLTVNRHTMQAIAVETLENAYAVENKMPLVYEVL